MSQTKSDIVQDLKDVCNSPSGLRVLQYLYKRCDEVCSSYNDDANALFYLSGMQNLYREVIRRRLTREDRLRVENC